MFTPEQCAILYSISIADYGMGVDCCILRRLMHWISQWFSVKVQHVWVWFNFYPTCFYSNCFLAVSNFYSLTCRFWCLTVTWSTAVNYVLEVNIVSLYSPLAWWHKCTDSLSTWTDWQDGPLDTKVPFPTKHNSRHIQLMQVLWWLIFCT